MARERLLLAIGVGLSVGLLSCERESDSHGHSHEDGDHSHDAPEGADADPQEHHHGEERSLGSVTIGEVAFDVTISGDVGPGADIPVELVQTAGPTPAAVRFWVGNEDGTGSIRAKAEADGNLFHNHVEAPVAIWEGAELWIEVEDAAGERLAASLPLE